MGGRGLDSGVAGWTGDEAIAAGSHASMVERVENIPYTSQMVSEGFSVGGGN